MADPFGAIFEAVQGGVRVAVVARVEEYRPATQEADVLLLVQEDRVLHGEREEVPEVRVYGAPVIWPGGGGRGLTMGLAVGDEVIALVRDRSHDEVDAGEPGPVVPVSTRRFSPADVVILPGYVRPAEGAPAGSYRTDGAPVLALPGGEALHVGAGTATFVLVRHDLLKAWLDTVKLWLDTHTHAHFMGPTLTPVAPSPTVADTSSPRIKVDS